MWLTIETVFDTRAWGNVYYTNTCIYYDIVLNKKITSHQTGIYDIIISHIYYYMLQPIFRSNIKKKSIFDPLFIYILNSIFKDVNNSRFDIARTVL